MLHALLHNKLDESIPEPRRLEDAVTSTVFGALLHADAGGLLAHWLSGATCIGSQTTIPEPPLRGGWFWPRLLLAEPDVVLLLGSALVIVEAKVGSGRHDGAAGGPDDLADDEGPITDQLCRQWESVSRDRTAIGGGRRGSAGELHAAIARSLPVLVYLVDERRLPRARRECAESAARLPAGADLRLLTWQSLHRLLAATHGAATPRWMSDLRSYLERIGLAGFVGFRRIPLDDPGTALSTWRIERALGVERDRLALGGAVTAVRPSHTAVIRSLALGSRRPGLDLEWFNPPAPSQWAALLAWGVRPRPVQPHHAHGG